MIGYHRQERKRSEPVFFGFGLGGKFDEQDRVSGSIGYNSIRDTDEVWLHRLFVKYNLKRQGIGSALLEMAENYIANQVKKVVRIHLGGEGFEESKIFYPKHGYVEYRERYMMKNL